MARDRRFWLRVVITALSGTLFGLALGGGIVVILATQFFDFKIITVESGSMAPTLEKGDVVVIRPTGIDDVHQDDIIYFNEPNTGLPFVHRVIAIQRVFKETKNIDTGQVIGETVDYFLNTKGDANDQPDNARVTDKDYAGKYWFSIPTFGVLGSGIPLQWVLIGFAGLIGVAWIAWEYFSRRNAPATSLGGGRGAQSAAEIRKMLRRRTTPPWHQRAGDWTLDRADDVLYFVTLPFFWIRDRVSGLRGRRAKARIVRPGEPPNPKRPFLRPWVMIPIGIWGMAVIAMFAVNASASPDYPEWDGWTDDLTQHGGKLPVVGERLGLVWRNWTPSPAGLSGEEQTGTPTVTASTTPACTPTGTPTPTPTKKKGNGTGSIINAFGTAISELLGGDQQTPTPAPSPSPSPTPSPSPAACPSPSPSPPPSPSPSPTDTPTATPSATPSSAASPSATATETGTATPTNSPTATSTPSATGTATKVNGLFGEESSGGTATATPTP